MPYFPDGFFPGSEVVTGTYTGAELIDQVKQIVGRKLATTSGLDLDTEILKALNEAQRRIARRCPYLTELQVKDTTTLDALTGTYSYSIATLAASILFIHDVWILNGTRSLHLEYRDKDDFDLEYPDPAAVTAGTPKYWTRRGSAIEFNCPVSSTYNGLAIRLDYTKTPTPFASTTSTAKSDLTDADDGLVQFALYRVRKIIDKSAAAGELTLFNEWLDEFEEVHDMESEELDNG